jgi:hypothetical protein
MEQEIEQFADQAAVSLVPGSISMEATRSAGDNMTFHVECHSHSPAKVQLDNTGALQDMTEFSPPSEDVAGAYLADVTFTSIGPHRINCINGTTSAAQRVFAGEIPVWDADKYKKNALEVIQLERTNAAKIAATTGTLNG